MLGVDSALNGGYFIRMVPRQIQELRSALCPRCGTANDVAVPKCHQCGEALHASALRRTEASNDSVPDALVDDAAGGLPAGSSAQALPSEIPLASPPDAAEVTEVLAGFAIRFEPDPGAPDRDRYTVKIARASAETASTETLVAADAAHAAFESITADLRAQFALSGTFAPDNSEPDRFSRAAMLDAMRTSMSSRAGMIAGAMFVAGLAAVAYLIFDQRPAVELSRLAVTDGMPRVVDARPGQEILLAPSQSRSVEAALTQAAAVLNRTAPSSPAGASPGPTLLQPQPARKAKPMPTPSLANAPGQTSLQRAGAVAPPKLAGVSTQAPSSRFGPCTAGVAALGLCTLESASGGN
jgi:hypothetical protein